LGFNTIILGSDQRAIDIFNDIIKEEKSSGNKIIGFLNIFEKENHPLSALSHHFGDYKKIIEVIHNNNVEEIIIAIEKKEHYKIQEILNKLDQTNVIIKVIPDMYDILLGRVKMNSILGTPLIEVTNDFQPEWEKRFKLFSDYLVAFFFVLIFSPVFIICALIIKLTSKGPVIFKQERLGINGQSFSIFKFRSMYLNSENDGPRLSSDGDLRITKFGKFMRKVRLDEIPQFFNILKGDMSFVGPRPERAYYADKLFDAAPHYKRIYKVKPGITSWGMVKFGYAQNIDEMLSRLKYDILYIENRSLLIDLKIMIHTIVIILERKGK
jgi:exopolysaccharide biosynthesis polyprenyl glycosylphosphotransferase